MNEKIRTIILLLVLGFGIGYMVWLKTQSVDVLDQAAVFVYSLR